LDNQNPQGSIHLQKGKLPLWVHERKNFFATLFIILPFGGTRNKGKLANAWFKDSYIMWCFVNWN
jgi:hypothetical protein